MKQLEDLITVQELAELLHCSKKTIYEAIKVETIKAIRISRVLRIEANEVRRLTGNMQDDLIDTNEAAQLLGISAQLARKWMRLGKLKGIKRSDDQTHWRISRKEVMKLKNV